MCYGTWQDSVALPGGGGHGAPSSPSPHRLVVADGVHLRAEHDGCEGEEEEAL